MRQPNLEKRVKAIKSRIGTDVVLLRFPNGTSVACRTSGDSTTAGRARGSHASPILRRHRQTTPPHVDPAVDNMSFSPARRV